MTRSARRPGAVLLLSALLLAGCTGGTSASRPGSPSASATSRPTTSPSATAAPHVARIAVLTSDTGALGAAGQGALDSVTLAAREASTEDLVPGWTFQAVAVNDGGNQSTGQQAASGLVGAPELIGVVGTLNSTIDEGVQPILNSAGVPMVSPAGTAVQLTRRLDGTTLVRPYQTYFRLAPTDADQGPAAARFVASRLHVRRAAVVSDGSSYGRLLAAGFAAEARRRGISTPVVRTLPIEPSATSPASKVARDRAVTAVARARAQVVFFGGSSAAAAAFATALHAAKVRVTVIGGDALLDGGFVAGAPPSAADGAYAVFAGAPPQALTTARPFLARYRAAGFAAEPGPYGATAYDAARALVIAFGYNIGTRTSIDASVLRGVAAGLEAVRFAGATGIVTFDEFGDAVDPPLTLYRLVAGQWRTAGVVRLGG